MKSKGLRLFRGILLLAVLPMCVTACVVSARVPGVEIWVDEEHRGPGHECYYYPDVGVYFDPLPRLYFWLDGGHWISGPRLPGHIAIHGRRERFRTDADRPYIVHERVTQRYRPGERERQVRERPGPPVERRERVTRRR